MPTNREQLLLDRIKELDGEVASLKKQLEERKLIERAKGVTMRLLRIDEADAFGRMQKYAADRNLKLADVAQTIIEAEQVFRDLQPQPRLIRSLGTVGNTEAA